MEPVRIGLLGLGTVGASVVDVLRRNASDIERRAGRKIAVTHAVVRDAARARDCGLDGIEISTDIETVVSNPDIDIVVELIGGETVALQAVEQAIANGKQVVTANKALIAKHGNDLFAAAQKAGVSIAFEAAVAGGIPIIKTIREGLAANRIDWVAGIINGTTNFILTEMREKGRPFADVLSEAQALGYAEADPTFDIEGIDAAHKLTIMGSIAYGIPLQFEKVYVEGITKITGEDVAFATELGYRIKHLGLAVKRDEGVEMRVHPTLVSNKHMLANVEGVMNAVAVHGDAVGATLSYGAGAGGGPTASSVVADIIEVVRTLTVDPEHRVPHLAFRPETISEQAVLTADDFLTGYYLRLRVADSTGVLNKITGILAEHSINIDAVLQKEPHSDGGEATVVLLTDPVQERAMNTAIAELEQQPQVHGSVVRIRLEHLI